MRFGRRTRPLVVLSHSASDEAEDTEPIAIFVLLEFLLGSSMRDICEQYQLRSEADAEELVRSAILQSGYDAQAD
jgi:hypothetical protein